jgi:hypothetical protein
LKGPPELKAFFCTLQSKTNNNLAENLDFIISQLKQFKYKRFLRYFVKLFVVYVDTFRKNISYKYLIKRLSEVLPKKEVQKMYSAMRQEFLPLIQAANAKAKNAKVQLKNVIRVAKKDKDELEAKVRAAENKAKAAEHSRIVAEAKFKNTEEKIKKLQLKLAQKPKPGQGPKQRGQTPN